MQQTSRERLGNKGMAIGPSDLFRVGDGWLLIQVTGQAMFKRWCRLVQEEAWFTDPRFANDELRAANGDALNSRMQDWCANKTLTETMAALDAARIPGAPMLSPLQAGIDPHVQAMGFFKMLDYPGLPRPAPVITTPFRMSATPGTIRSAAPVLGQHTDELLTELGFDAEAIAGLRTRMII